jgi:hypothetical protein
MEKKTCPCGGKVHRTAEKGFEWKCEKCEELLFSLELVWEEIP